MIKTDSLPVGSELKAEVLRHIVAEPAVHHHVLNEQLSWLRWLDVSIEGQLDDVVGVAP